MTVEVERGLAAYLRTKIEGLTVLESASNEDVPTDVPCVIVAVSCTRDAGNLWYGEAELTITTPAVHKTVDDHIAVLESIEDAFDEENGDAISDAVNEAAECVVDGFWYHTQRDEHGHNNRWKTMVSVTLGLVRAL
jgi:hypothetical protein